MGTSTATANSTWPSPTGSATPSPYSAGTATGHSSRRCRSRPAATRTNWGAVRNTAGGLTAEIWRNVGGTWTPLASAAVAGTGGHLRFEANGPSLKLFFNGVRVVTAYDTALTAAGSVGLRTNQGGRADDFFAFALGTDAALPAADPFTATAPLNQLSSQWTERAGVIHLATGAAVSTGVSLATLNGVSAGDVAVSATLPPPSVAPVGLGLVARLQSNGNMYWGALNRYPQDATQYMAVIWKYVNGTATPVNLNTAVVSAASAANGVLRFELLGASLKLYLNDALVSFGTDTTYATGAVGVQLTNGAIVDNFAAVARPPANATLPFADNFPGGSNPQNTLATTWQERSGAYSVAAGRATGLSTSQPNLATLNAVNAANAVIDGTFFFTAANQTAQLVGRYAGTGGTGDTNFYFADIVTRANGDALVRIRKDVNGTKTTLATTTLAGYFNPSNFGARNPAFRFVLSGSMLSAFVDGVHRLTATDISLTTGSVGIRTSVGAAVDSFLAS